VACELRGLISPLPPLGSFMPFSAAVGKVEGGGGGGGGVRGALWQKDARRCHPEHQRSVPAAQP
jgi:hypothetical protein